MHATRWKNRVLRAVSILAACSAARLGASDGRPVPAPTQAEVEGVKAFEQIVAVLRHPRCINCHTATNFPRQGDDGHPHANLVRRGLEGRGVPGQRCATCHQSENNAASGVPGATNWHLAPLSMAWEGLSDRELCRLFKDPLRNGDRDPEAIVEHVRLDPLASYAWNPGATRAPVPVPREEVVRLMDVWARNGAPCPR